MARSKSSNINSLNLLGPIMLLLYLCIGFVPNWQAVDKIAPQWLAMSILNLLSLTYFAYNRKLIGLALSVNLKASLTLTYIGFILWAIGSIFYAINYIEVIVNISRQINVMIMFVSMAIFLFYQKNKLRFIPWIITLILVVEIYAVLNQALQMINTTGVISSGTLKGLAANRNITAFSLAIKIPFVLFLFQLEKNNWFKLFLTSIICSVLIGLSMIQSRASFVAIGLIILAYFVLHTILYLKVNKKIKQFYQIGFLIISYFTNFTH